MKATVTASRALGEGWFVLEADAAALARRCRAGQFLQVRIGSGDDPLVRRPFSVFDVLPEPGERAERLQLLYQVVGPGTRWMARLRSNDEVDLLGPLGHPYPDPPLPAGGELFLVGGGIGVAPLYLHCREIGRQRPAVRHRVLLGARSAALLVGLEAFLALGVETLPATDDGSRGYHGNVVELLHSVTGPLPRDAIAGIGCGPHGMNLALRNFAVSERLPFWISLENYMPCGFGACFGCVIPSPPGARSRYRRVCLEGPAFPAEELPEAF